MCVCVCVCVCVCTNIHTYVRTLILDHSLPDGQC